MRHKLLQVLVGMIVLLAHLAPALAEDVDLFVGVPPTASALPNVIIILDNTANWNTPFEAEKAALVSVFNAMPTDKFRVGLMMFTESGGTNSGADGAYVRAAARTITSSNKSLYAAQINALEKVGDKSNGGKVAKAMWEAYQYLLGLAPHAGTGKAKADYAANIEGYASDDALHALAGNALGSKTAGLYTKPSAEECIKNYIIYISNGPAQDNSSDISEATAALAAAGGSTTAIPLNPSGSQDNPADEWARWIKKSALKGSVYTLDVNKSTSGQGPGWSALLKSMASSSGGRYFDVSTDGIAGAINAILSEVLSVNSVFASVSLPVSVNTQGTYLNQVFVGMFRPDSDGSPRWAGNLKQYKMAVLDGKLQMVDADNSAAINNQTGFITECARSFWTPTTLDTEWATASSGDCLAVANSAASNYPDGNVVSKGAQAYKLRAGLSSRTSYTCNDAACTSLVAFSGTNVSDTSLAVSGSTARDALIGWAKGTDSYEDENINGSSTDARLSMHGDVVHSRPVALNFGTSTSPRVVVFYGGNDGWFRAVNGNRSDPISSHAAGSELWSFVPPEFLGKFSRLRSKSPVVYYPGTLATGATRKDYAMDGPIAAYRGTVGGSTETKTFVYATMRRGGRSIYAFDVSNLLTSPNAPALKWRIGCRPDGTCTSGMDGVGQTWGAIKTFTHASYSSGNTPLLIFGGGYDACEDEDNGTANHACTASSKGHYIYVVDANTGALVRAFDTKAASGATIGRGIISDVVLSSSADGHAKYGYVGDLGGSVFRIKFDGAPSSWSLSRIASLGCSTTSTCDANRKFMFAPSVVKIADGEFSILIGSGDREKPILSVENSIYRASASVPNYFFAFTDKPETTGYPGTADCGADLICLNSLYQISRTSTSVNSTELGLKKGWYLQLNSTEQVVTHALTIFSVASFSTHEPAVAGGSGQNTCTNLGTTRLYEVNYKDATSSNGTDLRYHDVVGDGLPPAGTAGLVTLDDGSTVPFCIGCSAESPLQAELPNSSSGAVKPRGRLYWYINKK